MFEFDAQPLQELIDPVKRVLLSEVRCKPDWLSRRLSLNLPGEKSWRAASHFGRRGNVTLAPVNRPYVTANESSEGDDS